MKINFGKLMAMMLIVFIFLTSCALWKEKATVIYEGVGDILTQTYTSAKQLCDNGTLKAEDCVKIKDMYNKTRAAYIVAGDVLIASMNLEASINSTKDAINATKDAVEKKELEAKLPELQAQFQALMIQYNQNLQDAAKLAAEFQELYYELGGK